MFVGEGYLEFIGVRGRGERCCHVVQLSESTANKEHAGCREADEWNENGLGNYL